MKRVLLLGKGSQVVRTARWLRDSPDHDLVAMVPVVPEPTWTESPLQWCRDTGTPHVTSGSADEGLDLAEDLGGADLVLSIFYDRILSRAFLARAPRALNLHNGPLPRYRGVSPVNWALRNGETQHGVTLHEIAPGVDDGDLIAQVLFSLYPDIDEVEDAYARTLAHGWTLLETVLPLIDQIVPRAQDHEAATTYRRSQDDQLGDRLAIRRPGR